MDKTKLLEHADKLLGFVFEDLEQSKEFVLEQAPLLIQETIQWGVVSNTIYASICFAFTLVIGFLAYKLFINDDSEVAALDLFPASAGLIAFFVGLSYAMSAVKAFVAPRLYLLEMLQSLLHTQGGHQ